jgi:hypothetical protein
MRLFLSASLIMLFCANVLGQSEKSSSDNPTCAVDVRWLNTNGSLTRARSSESPEQLSFLVHLGRGNGCSTADVSVSAAFLTDSQEYICSGTIRSAMNVSSQIQTFNIALRPFTQLDFLRWRNQPGARGEQPGKRLDCLNVDGTADVGDATRQKAGWIRLSIAVSPAGGALALTEAVLRIVP